MNTLVIYDNLGNIFSMVTGDYSTPQGGIQFIEVSVPEGKRVVGVDVTSTPHKSILEDIPPSEFQTLDLRTKDLEMALSEILFGGM